MAKSAWMLLLASAPTVMTLNGVDWSIDILCMLIAGFAGALTQWKLVIDKKVTAWAAIPLEITIASVGGFIAHALIREHVDDLRKLIVYVFGIGFAGTPGLRFLLRGVLPQIYGDKNNDTGRS